MLLSLSPPADSCRQTAGVSPAACGLIPGRLGAMMRKLLWLVGLAALSSVVVAVVDRQKAERRRQLWAEATD